MLRRSRQEQYAYVIKAYDGEVGSGHPSTGNFRRLGVGNERPLVLLGVTFIWTCNPRCKHFHFPFLPSAFRISLQPCSAPPSQHQDSHWTPGHSAKIKFTDFAASDFFANTGPPKELSVTQRYIVSCIHSRSQALGCENLVRPNNRVRLDDFQLGAAKDLLLGTLSTVMAVANVR